VAVFFLSLLPQFVDPGQGFTMRLLLLSGLCIAMGLVWLTTYTLALHAVSTFVGRPPVRTVIETSRGASSWCSAPDSLSNVDRTSAAQLLTVCRDESSGGGDGFSLSRDPLELDHAGCFEPHTVE
jgi:hypothetical protein